MKLVPITKLDKKNMAMSKNVDNDFISANYDVIVTFLFTANFEQTGSRIPDE